jgi:hypothetical protein
MVYYYYLTTYFFNCHKNVQVGSGSEVNIYPVPYLSKTLRIRNCKYRKLFVFDVQGAPESSEV